MSSTQNRPEAGVGDLADRAAVVTGGSRGIGAATAMALAARGASVAVVGRDAATLAPVVQRIVATGARATAVVADLADPDGVESVVPTAADQLGGVDILVNNAGFLPAATRSERLSRADWEATLAVNLTAPWALACRAHDLMVARGGGVVINISSTASMYASVGLAHYCASKAALEMTTRVLAVEWARDNVRVLGIAPGRVDTELLAPIVAYDAKRGARPNPLGRLGRPEEVATTIAFLCTDAAAYMTGSTVVIDGGEVAGLAVH